MQGWKHFSYPYNYQLQAFTIHVHLHVQDFSTNFFPGLCRTISNIYVDFMESNPLAPPSINHSMWTPHNLLSIPYTSFRGLKTFKARTSGRLNDVIISMHLHIKNWKIFNRIIYSSSEYICLQ